MTCLKHILGNSYRDYVPHTDSLSHCNVPFVMSQLSSKDVARHMCRLANGSMTRHTVVVKARDQVALATQDGSLRELLGACIVQRHSSPCQKAAVATWYVVPSACKVMAMLFAGRLLSCLLGNMTSVILPTLVKLARTQSRPSPVLMLLLIRRATCFKLKGMASCTKWCAHNCCC